MRQTSRTIGVFAGVIASSLVFGNAPAPAADWPQWRGANRDGGTADFTPPPAWPKTLPSKWKTTVGLGDATPALVGDRLYVFARPGNEEITTCLEAATGKIIWQDKYPATVTVEGMGASHSGPRSSPAVAGGMVVTQDEGATISCLDAEGGKVVWRKDFTRDLPAAWPKFFTATSPVILDGACIVQLGGQGKGAVIAIDLASGEVKWKWEGEAPAYASPAVITVEGQKQVVALTERSVVGINAADGKLAWQAAFGGGGGMGMGGRGGGPGGGGPSGGGPGGGGPGGGGPGTGGPGTGGPGGGGPGGGGPGGRRGGFGGGPGGGGRGMRGGGGGMSYNAASPVVNDQTVILTSPGAGTKALKVEKTDAGFAAKELWTNKETSAQFSTPVLKDGRLYGISGGGNFFCIDIATGKTLWTSPERYGERGFGTVVYAGSVMLSLTSGSDLVVFTPGDKAYAEIARLKLSNVPSYSYPVAAGNRVFIKDRDSVMMYAIE